MSKILDLTGKRFGKLVAIERDITKKRVYWICQCDCGSIKSIMSTHLRSGASTSCGCYQKECASKANKTHGMTHTSLHNRWKAIRQRCTNPKDSRYKNYGNRGITLCEEWNNFERFAKWSLENGYQDGLELDRIDNDKGYFPENCRWCKSIINNHNRRNTAKIDGIPLQDFAKMYQMDYKIVHYRYYRLKKFNQEITTKNIITYANQLPLNGESH